MVQRRVGQHDAGGIGIRPDARGQHAGQGREQGDGTGGPGEELPGDLAYPADAAGGFNIRHHDGQGLVGPVLARP